MFFSWYARSRHFKQKSNRSGQIFPVLLICIAALLVAVIVAIRVGESAKAKTHASNAADAGSLATASYQAGAFNKLVDRNKADRNVDYDNFGQYMTKEDTYQYYKRMKYYFLETQARYKFLYELGNYYLYGTAVADYSWNGLVVIGKPAAPEDNAYYWMDQAIKKLEEALVHITADNIPEDEKNCAIGIDPLLGIAYQLLGIEDNEEAARLLKQSRLCIGAFYIIAEYEEKLAKWFKEGFIEIIQPNTGLQTRNFCEAKKFMQGEDGVSGAWKKSREAGQTYGFNNSAIMAMLSGLVDSSGNWLGDDFNFHLATGDLFGGPTAIYSWPDPANPANSCFVSVNVDLPNITKYQIKHTLWNWPKKHSLWEVPFPCGTTTCNTTKCGIPPCDRLPCDPLSIPNSEVTEDPFNVASALTLYDDLVKVENYIGCTLIGTGGKILCDEGAGADCCNCECDGSWKDCSGTCGVWPNEYSKKMRCDPHPYYAEALTLQGLLEGWEGCVIEGLTQIRDITDPDANPSLSIPVLRWWNDEIWNNVWNGERLNEVSTCRDVINWPDPETQYLGMVIIDINNVTLDATTLGREWKTKCTVTASCGGSTTTSWSISKFYGEDGGKGENIGLFIDDYYPEIVETDK